MNSGGAVSEILLVEDNPNDVELILHVFQWCNLADRIHVAWNGEEALDYLFGTGSYEGKPGMKPKVILLDLKLPKVDGLEVLRKIKGDSSTRSIPVVVFTSSREERDILDSYNLGVNSYIVKPVQFDQFANVIRDLGLYWQVINQPPVDNGTRKKAE
ncbi:MAG: response regulator [Methanoregulaceae archaeon]|jgi:CheY-like chemotaxis protein|nr:response regulator [Methanoregulaceae archaeon]